MKRTRLSIRFDANEDTMRADPYPAYASSRASDGLMRLGPGQWGITRHADVCQLLAAEGVGSALSAQHLAISHRNKRVAKFLSRIVLYAEPPRHTALRRALAPATSASAVSAVARQMADICAPILSVIPAQTSFDILSDIATPVSAATLCRLLQVDGALAEELPEAARALGAIFATGTDEQALDRASQAIDALADATMRAQSVSPILIEIAQRARIEGIDTPTLYDNLAFFAFAAFETTAAMIGNAVAWLLADAAHMSSLCQGDVDAVVDAALRDDPPIQGVVRVLGADREVCGMPLRAGRVLVLFLASANRDETPALSFGGGRHRCPGEALARAELKAVLDWIGRSEKQLVATGPATRDAESQIRRYQTLPVRFGSADLAP